MAYKPPPQQIIERLLSRTEHGDVNAFSRLVYIYNRNRTIANSRMQRLRHAGLAGIGSYNRAEQVLDAYGTKTFVKFTEERAEDEYEKFVAYLRASVVFTRSNLSRVGAVKKSVDAGYNFWASREDGEWMSRDEYMELYSSGILQEMLEYYGSPFMKDMADFMERGGTIDRVITRAQRLLNGELVYADLFR